MLNKEKICVIIGGYPQNHMDTMLLSLSIESFKRRGYDICLVSHAPVSNDLQKSTKYFIYSDENYVLNFPKVSNLGTFHSDEILHYQNNYNNSVGTHSLAILMNIKNALCLINNKKYENFIYAECDSVLNSDDHRLLESKLEEMSFHTKDYWFMVENFLESDMTIPVTSLFGGKISYFHEKLNQINSEEDYFTMCESLNSYTLESLFSLIFLKNVNENCYIDYDIPRNIFSSKWLGCSGNGKISIPEFDNPFDVEVDIVKSGTDNDNIYFVLNFNQKKEPITLKMYGDNILICNCEVITGLLHYYQFAINGVQNWRFEVHYQNKLFKEVRRPTSEILWNNGSFITLKVNFI